MKTILYFLMSLCLISAAIYGLCAVNKHMNNNMRRAELEEANDPIFNDSKHRLKELVFQKNNTSSIDTEFFHFLDKENQKTNQIQDVQFAWEIKNGSNEYVITKMDVSRIIIKIDNSISAPYVKFSHGDYLYRVITENIQKSINYNVDYAEITCRESDWPRHIQTPTLKNFINKSSF